MVLVLENKIIMLKGRVYYELSQTNWQMSKYHFYNLYLLLRNMKQLEHIQVYMKLHN